MQHSLCLFETASTNKVHLFLTTRTCTVVIDSLLVCVCRIWSSNRKWSHHSSLVFLNFESNFVVFWLHLFRLSGCLCEDRWCIAAVNNIKTRSNEWIYVYVDVFSSPKKCFKNVRWRCCFLNRVNVCLNSRILFMCTSLKWKRRWYDRRSFFKHF